MYFNFLLQGKEEFEKNQRQLMEKGSIKHNKTVLEQQQVWDYSCYSIEDMYGNTLQ